MRSGAKVALAGGVFLVVVGGTGIGAYTLVSDINGDLSSDARSGAERVKAGPPTRAEVRDTARKFLDAWAADEPDEAASYTNNAEAAALALTGFREEAHVSKAAFSPQTPTGADVPFSVSATVSFKGHRKPWSYDGRLTVVRGEKTGRPLVDWKPSVVHPDMAQGDTLRTGEAAAPPIEAVDRNGTVPKKGAHPSLGPVLDSLREKYGEQAGGKPGVELWIEGQGEGAPDQTLLSLAAGTPGTLRTTLSATAQAAAEKAVERYDGSSVVALKPSTGEILAVANHDPDGFNAAFLGKMAPGSTMKIVSAALLIDKGLTSAAGPAPCPPTATWQSQTFHNLKGMAPDENATFADDFARSCNTAFVKFADEITPDDLTRKAQEDFGLGRENWKAGVPTFDGSVPAAGEPDTAAALIGQGQIQMNPLNLASVTATARTGSFHQPVIVPRSLDDRPLATARGLSAGTAQQLRQMMQRTAVSGTGATAMAGLGPDMGAKTGSAEVDGQEVSNSWFSGYRGDLAAAAMAQEGGHGGDTAGPIVAAVLRSGG